MRNKKSRPRNTHAHKHAHLEIVARKIVSFCSEFVVHGDKVMMDLFPTVILYT